MRNSNGYKRGSVYLADIPLTSGSVQSGKRPVVIVSNDTGNTYSPVVIVCTLTSKAGKKKLPTHLTLGIEDGLNMISDVQGEQILTIDKSCIISEIPLCTLSRSVMRNVDNILKISLGMDDGSENIIKSVLYEVEDMIISKKVSAKALLSIASKLKSAVGTKDSNENIKIA